jgi:hypothetical protein
VISVVGAALMLVGTPLATMAKSGGENGAVAREPTGGSLVGGGLAGRLPIDFGDDGQGLGPWPLANTVESIAPTE